jgi:hypothetical protein
VGTTGTPQAIPPARRKGANERLPKRLAHKTFERSIGCNEVAPADWQEQLETVELDR